MAIGTPYSLGEASNAPSTSTTLAVTLTHAVAPGDCVAVICSTDGSGVTVSSVTDSQSQTYTAGPTDYNNATGGIALFYFLNSTAMTTSDTITATFSSNAGSETIVARGCAGIATSSAVDVTRTNDSPGSAAPSSGSSGTLASASEWLVAGLTNGNGGGSPTAWTGGFTSRLVAHAANNEYLTFADQVVSATAAKTAGATVASTKWAMVLATFKAATGGSLAISTTSPLTAGTLAVPYSNTLAASGGVPPYTWDFSSGSYASLGLTLSSGSGGGGGGGPLGYAGTNLGPQGAPTLGAWNLGTYGNTGGTGTFGAGLLGTANCYKVFFSIFPTAWSGTLADQITAEQPGVFIYICWNNLASPQTISSFIASIPSTIAAVGFCWNSEPENTGASGLSKTTFQSGWASQMGAVFAAKGQSKGAAIYTMTTAYLGYYQGGSTNPYNYTTDGNAWIPPVTYTDIYGIDFYDRHVYAVGADMSSTNGWIQWTNYVKGLGKPLAIAEYGLSGWGTDAAQNQRLQADWAYLQGAFGAGGTLSTQPLFCWLYWDTGATAATLPNGGAGQYTESPSPPYNKNQFLGTGSEAAWKAITATANNVPGASGASSSAGGVISGTPTSATTANPTVRVTDSTGATATKALSLTINSGSALSVSTSDPLPGATNGAAYSTLLQAAGGTPPYTWDNSAGTPPTGLTLSPAGVLSGTPTVNGTTSATYRATDSAAATATAVLHLTVSAAGITLSPSALPSATVNISYSQVITASGGTSPYGYNVSSGVLPPGLQLDPDGSLTGTAGTLSGTPTAIGAYPFTVTAADAGGATGSQNYSITVQATGTGSGIGRPLYGGDAATWGFTKSGSNVTVAAGAVWKFYTAASGGSQITDLLDSAYNPVTQTGGNPITSVTLDSNGFPPQFYAPAGQLSGMWADANNGAGPRHLILPVNLGSYIATLWNTLIGG